MSTIRTFLSRHALIAGLVLMFALTWPIDLAYAGLLPIEIPFAAYLFLGWGFVLAALIMTGLTQGKMGVAGLLKRYLIWRVGLRWYVFALGLYPVMFLAALGMIAVWRQASIDLNQTMAAQFFGASASWPFFVLPYFLFEAVANGEEMGWRGYVLPRLQAVRGPLTSALIVGVIWGFWHLPKFLSPFDPAVFSMVMVKNVADSVLYTWLYNNTRGSLLLVTLFHAAGNTAAFFLLPSVGVDGRVGVLLLIVLLDVLTVTGLVVSTRSTLHDARSPAI